MAAFQFASCRLDPGARELRVGGAVVHVEPQVFDVLAYLVSKRDRMIPETELLDAVWGSQFVSDSALTSRIKSARSAIGGHYMIIRDRVVRTRVLR
jgi:DNA-binding winged helix-turn-helix (wHTH) protein